MITKKVIYKNLNLDEIGQFCFYMGTFFLPSFIALSALFFLVALFISFFRTKYSIYKDKWSISLYIISGFLVTSAIKFYYGSTDNNIFSFDKSISFFSLLNWLPLFLIFIFFQHYLRDKRKRYLFAKFIILGTIPILISCALQAWFKIYGPFEFFGGLLVWFNKPPIKGGGISGLFSNQNYTAIWLAATLPFLISLFSNHKRFHIKKIFLGLLIIFTVYFLILTTSRNAIASLFLSAILVLGLKKLVIITLFLILLTFLLNIVQILFPFSMLFDNLTSNSLFESVKNSNLQNKIIYNSRIDIWIESIKLIFEKPIFGYGAATYPLFILFENVQHAHNLPIQIAYDYGLPSSFLLTFFISFLFLKFSLLVLKTNFNDINSFSNKCWLTSFSIIVLCHTTDITYYDGKISIFIWIFLAGIKSILDEEQTINIKDIFSFPKLKINDK